MARATAATTDSKQTALDRDALALHEAVADLVRVYQFRDRDRICCHDVSVTQCYALETIVEHGPLRLRALADRLFLDKSTTSRVVSTLVRKGYVEQRADAKDGRATTLSATRQGQRLCARITDDLVDQQKQLLQDLDPDCPCGRRAGAPSPRARGGCQVPIRSASEAGATCCAAGDPASACD